MTPHISLFPQEKLTPEQARIHALAFKAIQYMQDKKTVCMASLGIRSEEQDLMNKVVKAVKGMGYYMKKRVAESREGPYWAGSGDFTYYEITNPLCKVVYYEKTQAPENGYTQLSFFVEQSDKKLSAGYDGTPYELQSLELDNYVACKVLVPYMAHVWLGADNEIYYSTSLQGVGNDGIITKAEKY